MRKTLKDLIKNKFDPSVFESKWQKIWEEKRVYQPDLTGAKKPYYNLMMFPYPSAEGLHVGNMYAFTGVDIHGRFQRMKGYDVFEPIGLDGFGIHSENYALKVGKHPRVQAKISQDNFYRQLHAIGNGFAWENTLETYDPDYYKWTQWVFTTMFNNGLAYRKKSSVNFCPSCKTVLSDEQVIDGKCERCKNTVSKKEMEQWFFRITKYAERLLQNTYRKDFRWTHKVKLGQQNWIGKKTGINITYEVVDREGRQLSAISYQQKEKIKIPTAENRQPKTVTCFTTRPDTNFGATFVVVGPEHEFVMSLLNSKFKIQNSKLNEIKKYVDKAKAKSEMERIAEGREKTGVFTGFYAVNQLTGYKMPIYITDFVLGHVGTGAVVGVPGHDLRDFQFAKKFDLEIIRVVVGVDGDKSEITREEQIQEDEGTMINSGFLDGMDIHKATEKIMDYMERKGWGKRVTTYKLRDWCISRQRYWGAPIPMIYCEKCDWVAVPDEDLPVLLPDLKDWKPEGTGKGPLAKLEEFIRTKCPKCGGEARRETDVCDTFLDSSWYFFRYPSISKQKTINNKQKEIPNSKFQFPNSNLPWNEDVTRRWLPVHSYIGGAEHTVLHLLYARFVTMVFKDLGLIEFEEPFQRFYAHGLIIAEGAKMSKSRGNVVVPDVYIKKYGADALRTYLMFLGPFDMGGDFRDTGIAGMHKFLARVWRLVISYQSSAISKTNNTDNWELDKFMHKTIKAVTDDMENLRYNTAIAHIMEFVNELSDNRHLITDNHIKSLLLMLAPFAPHMTEELWQSTVNSQQITDNKKPTTHNLQHTTYNSIHLHPWPIHDPKMLVEDEVIVIAQVNGKVRDTIKVKRHNSQVKSEVEKLARDSESIKKYLENRPVRKVIFVPGKLINFVV